MISPEITGLIEHGPELASIGLLIHALAFSKPVRKLIGKRDNWECQEEDCDKAFFKGDMVHASHLNHDRNNPMYDEPETGEILCVEHHKWYHIRHRGIAGEIGLCEEGNEHAIAMLENTNTKVKK